MKKQPLELQKHLRRCFKTHIFRRGEEYFRYGNVGEVEMEKHVNHELCASAIVRGGEKYDTLLWFDEEEEEFTDFECSCPYGLNCKHAAALGLAFIAQYSGGNPDDTYADKKLEELNRGLSSDPLSILDGDVSDEDIERTIVELQSLKQKRQDQNFLPPNRKPELVSETADPLKNCYIVFSPWSGNFSLRNKHLPYQQASVNDLLKEKNALTEEQVELLKIVKSSQSHYHDTSATDFRRAFELIKNTGVKVSNADQIGYEYGENFKVSIPQEMIKAELYFTDSYDYRDEKPRFVFGIPKTLANYNTRLFTGKDQLVRTSGRNIDIYHMSSTLASIIARAMAFDRYDYGYAEEKNKTHHEIVLKDAETININNIISDAKQFLDLSCDLKPDYDIKEYKDDPKKILVVDFRSGEASIAVKPFVDYGFHNEDISESVFVSRSGGSISFRRRNGLYDRPDTHIIKFKGKKISYARIAEKLEESFFAELYDSDALPNKTPRFMARGFAKIMKFYEEYWPRLVKKCAQIGCEIRFANDKLYFESKNFRADFTIDMEADNDWLFFDAAFYLGNDKITVEDLMRFIERDSELFRHSDGRLSKITNIEELKRLVFMLETFKKRQDGGFEGKLYHAPELEYIATSSKHYNSRYSKGFNKFCKDIKFGKPVRRIKLPEKIRKILRPYQIAGIEWMYFLRSYNFAGILADDMGLGKTLQTLVILEREKIKGKPSIVICPKTLVYNWLSEVQNFTPEIKAVVVDGFPTERAHIIRNAKKYDLLITGYATYKIDSKKYKTGGTSFNYCVLDEAQFIKNHATKNAQIVKEVDASFRLALTGTPLENSVSEIWSIFDFLMPGFLGSYEKFSKRFHRPIMEKGDVAALELLRNKVKCFMLRRIKSEVLKELPPKIIQDSHCHLNKAQNVLYQEVLLLVKREIFKTVKQKGFKRSSIHILAGLTKLRQICNHPNLLLKEKDYRKYESAKLNMFNELVEEVRDNRRKVLVFSQFTEMLDILSAELKAKNIPHCYLSGKTRNRKELVSKFNADPEIPVFLISLKAGGTGLNLTSADTVIVFDPWWNPSVENQAIDRAHRIGQKKSVNVYKLITKGTIEEKIISLQSKKKGLFDSLVGESKNLFKKLTWDDVQELFK